MNTPPPLRTNWFVRLLLWISGTSTVVIAKAPTEVQRCAAIGLLLFIPVSAAFFGSFHTASALGVGKGVSFAAAAFIAVIVGLFDYGICATFRKHRSTWPVVALRMIGAGAIGFVVSYVGILALSAGRIDAWLIHERQKEIAGLKDQSETRIDKLVNREATDLAQLKAKADRLVKDRDNAATTIARKDVELADWQQKLDAEEQGKRASGLRGTGDDWKATYKKFAPVEKEVAELKEAQAERTKQLTEVEKQMTALRAAALKNPLIQAEQKETATEVEATRTVQRGDLFSREHALRRIAAEDPGTDVIRWALMIVFAACDLSVVFLKVFAPAGPYDNELEKIDFASETDLTVFKKNYPQRANQHEAQELARELARLTVAEKLSLPQAWMEGMESLRSQSGADLAALASWRAATLDLAAASEGVWREQLLQLIDVTTETQLYVMRAALHHLAQGIGDDLDDGDATVPQPPPSPVDPVPSAASAWSGAEPDGIAA